MNASTEQPISKFWSKINLMAEIAAIFRNAPPEKSTYCQVLDLINKVANFNSAALYLNSSNKRRVIDVASYGNGFDPSPYDTIEDFMGWMSLQRKPELLSASPRYAKIAKERGESVLIVPLLVEDRLIGNVVYIAENLNAFAEKDLKLLTVIGDQIALSIERLIYQRELERKNTELYMAQEQIKKAHDEILTDEKLSAVRQLAVSVNHEINNPLSVITGNVEFLLYIFKDLDPKIVDRLKIIESEALRIADINRRLLDIQTLVEENYVLDDNKTKMINIEKSSSGEKL